MPLKEMLDKKIQQDQSSDQNDEDVLMGIMQDAPEEAQGDEGYLATVLQEGKTGSGRKLTPEEKAALQRYTEGQ